jgi:hypothetical protein
MEEEYEMIREGLLGLICIGDKINHIFFGSGGSRGIIKPYYVIEISDKEPFFLVTNETGRSHEISSNMIEAFSGELYTWNCPPKFWPYRTPERIGKMFDIIGTAEID